MALGQSNNIALMIVDPADFDPVAFVLLYRVNRSVDKKRKIWLSQVCVWSSCATTGALLKPGCSGHLDF